MSAIVQTPSRTLLVVDDEPTNICILGETLRDQYRLVVATNGDQALERARSSPKPDLILLDVQMPGISGYEVCKRLKQDDALKTIPVIFITVLSSAEDETFGFELGAVDYICKPFNPSVVKARVHTHVELQLHRERLQDLVEEKTHDLRRAQKELVTRLAWIPEQLLSVMATVDEMSNACSSCSNASARIIRHNIEVAIQRVIEGEGPPLSRSEGDADQQEPTADHSGGISAAGLEHLKTLVAVLRPLLEEHSFESEDTMNSAASFLITLPHGELVDTLREQVGQFEYAAATATLDQLLQASEIHGG